MLDDKDFWGQFLKSSNDPQEERRTPVGRSLDPDYRAEEKPTTTDPPKERTFDIDAILADIHKQTASKARDVSDTPPSSAMYRKPTPKLKVSETDSPAPTGRSAANRAVTPPNSTPPAPPSNAPPGDNPADDKQVMREMTAAMRELTDELRQFRAQMEEHPYDIASYPRGRPEIPEKLAHLSDGLDTPPADSSSETYFSGFVMDGYGGPDPEGKPNIRGEPEEIEEKPKEKKKGNKAVSIISNILFYTVIVAIVLGAFLLRSTSKGEPFMIAGISAANVLTSSMEDVYPRGSLIITKQIDAKELKIGDDITFMVSEDSSITHRIIGITENYQGTGQRAFETKGTKNPNPDKEMVAAANVVGKVIFHSKVLGDFANFVKANWPILIFALIVLIGLISFLKWNAKKSDGDSENEEESKEKPKEKKPRSHTKNTFRKEKRKQWR